MQDIRGINKEVGAADICLVDVHLAKLGELVLGGLPGEIGIGLGETRLR